MAVSIAGVLVATGTFFDLADTTSIVDAIDITGQTVYSDQGFVSVQVKNNGNTAIDGVYATLLIDGTANCNPGTTPAIITPAIVARAAATAVPNSGNLNPGDSITISGGLLDMGVITVANVGTATAVSNGAGAITVAQVTAGDFDCDGGEIEDRGEYILQISGLSDGDPISKTITVRAR